MPKALDHFTYGTGEQGSDENNIHWNPLGATHEGYVTEALVANAIAAGYLPEDITADEILENNMTWDVLYNKYEHDGVMIDGVEYTAWYMLYNKALTPSEETLPTLFRVTLDSSIDIDPNGDMYRVKAGVATPINWNINTDGAPVIYISAYAVQKEGFATVDDAFKAYNTQWDTNDNAFADASTAVTTVSNDKELAAALAGDARNIRLQAGNYGVIDVAGLKRDVTIFASKDDQVTIAGIDGQSNNLTSNITIKGVTIDNSKQTEGWFTGTAQKINPCVGVWGGNYTFEDCTFNVIGGSKYETGVMSWWTTQKGVMNFKNCTFNGSDSSARGMQIYGMYDLNVEGCTFNTAKDYSLKYVGAEGTVATFKNNKVYATQNFVQTGSAPYAGENYKLVFVENELATGINHVFVDNDEGQTIIINGVES